MNVAAFLIGFALVVAFVLIDRRLARVERWQYDIDQITRAETLAMTNGRPHGNVTILVPARDDPDPEELQ